MMWLKCIWHSKNAIFTQKFAMSATAAVYYILFIVITIKLSLGNVADDGNVCAWVEGAYIVYS